MKMEYFMKAQRDGVIETIKVREGDTVEMKQELAKFAKVAEESVWLQNSFSMLRNWIME